MSRKRAFAWSVILGALLSSLLSCASVREKTDSYIMTAEGLLSKPVDAWLRTVEVISDNLPLSEDYPLIRDALGAIASRHGFLLSSAEGGQPCIVDFVVHERTYAADLSTSSSVMAIMNISLSSDDTRSAVRVVYSAIAPDSVESLYRLSEIAEKMFTSLASRLAEEAKSRAKAEADLAAGAKANASAEADAGASSAP